MAQAQARARSRSPHARLINIKDLDIAAKIEIKDLYKLGLRLANFFVELKEVANLKLNYQTSIAIQNNEDEAASSARISRAIPIWT